MKKTILIILLSLFSFNVNAAITSIADYVSVVKVGADQSGSCVINLQVYGVTEGIAKAECKIFKNILDDFQNYKVDQKELEKYLVENNSYNSFVRDINRFSKNLGDFNAYIKYSN